MPQSETLRERRAVFSHNILTKLRTPLPDKLFFETFKCLIVLFLHSNSKILDAPMLVMLFLDKLRVSTEVDPNGP